MNLPTNNDIANRELSIDELDAVAGGGLLGWIEGGAKSVWHDVQHGIDAVLDWAAPQGKITVTFGRPPGSTPYKVS
jgi:hypothetical protein